MARLMHPLSIEQEGSEDVFLISMSDLAWNLVVVFIVVSASAVADVTARLRGLDLQLGSTVPGSVGSETEPPTATVSISADGRVALDGEVLGPVTEVSGLLKDKLRESLSRDSDKCSVWVVPDRGASWDCVTKVHGVVSGLSDNFLVIAQEEIQQ